MSHDGRAFRYWACDGCVMAWATRDGMHPANPEISANPKSGAANVR